jgi:hypothetical protein
VAKVLLRGTTFCAAAHLASELQRSYTKLRQTQLGLSIPPHVPLVHQGAVRREGRSEIAPLWVERHIFGAVPAASGPGLYGTSSEAIGG